MLRAERIAKRQRLCDQALAELEQRSQVSLSELLPEQRAVLFAALQVLTVLLPVPPLRRVVGYFLLHCGLGLSSRVIGAVMELGPRALSLLKQSGPADLIASLRRPKVGTKPKLLPEHLGPLCRFVVDHPRATLHQVHDFVRKKLGVSVKRHALRRYFQRYSLGVLRDERVEARPLFAVTPPTQGPSSCSVRPSA